jgi:hypothetical protein
MMVGLTPNPIIFFNNREKVTDDVVKQFFSKDREFDMSRSDRSDFVIDPDTDYSKYGIHFDLSFGAQSPDQE